MTDIIENDVSITLLTRDETGRILDRDIRYYNYEDIPLHEDKNDYNER